MTGSPSTSTPPTPTKTVALCLGSGGARGYAHIGVIDALEARGYRIIAIAGCSIGALVGGFYAAGKLHDYREWVCRLKYLDVIKLLDFSFISSGMIRGDRLYNHIDELIGDLDISDLPMPYTAIATDLSRYKEVWFQRGSLAKAIRASSAIPGMFTPVEIEGRLMVDGAVLNPLPIIPCVSAHADLIIAVDLSGDVPIPLTEQEQLQQLQQQEQPQQPTAKNGSQEWFGKFVNKAGEWLDNLNLGNHSEEERENLGKLGVINRVIDVMSSSLTQYKVAGYPPDLLIKIPRDACETYDFHRAQEMIDLGRNIAEQALQAHENGQSNVYGQVF